MSACHSTVAARICSMIHGCALRVEGRPRRCVRSADRRWRHRGSAAPSVPRRERRDHSRTAVRRRRRNGQRSAYWRSAARAPKRLSCDAQDLIDDPDVARSLDRRTCAAIPVLRQPSWNARAAEARALRLSSRRASSCRAPAHGIVWATVEPGEIRLMGGIIRLTAPAILHAAASGMWIEARAQPLCASSTAKHCQLRIRGGRSTGSIRLRCCASRSASQSTPRARSERLARRARSYGAGRQLLERARCRASCRTSSRLVSWTAPIRCSPPASIVGRRSGRASCRRRNRRLRAAGIRRDAAEIARASQLRVAPNAAARRLVAPQCRAAGRLARREREPVALIAVRRRYIMVEPDGSAPPVDADARSGARSRSNHVLSAAAVARGSAADLLRFLRTLRPRGTVARIVLRPLRWALLTLATPLITEVLVDSVIPRTELDQLAFCAAALVMVAIGIGRLPGRAGHGHAAARRPARFEAPGRPSLDRLLRLPVSFFREYTAGDLADRTLGIEAIRRIADRPHPSRAAGRPLLLVQLRADVLLRSPASR